MPDLKALKKDNSYFMLSGPPLCGRRQSPTGLPVGERAILSTAGLVRQGLDQHFLMLNQEGPRLEPGGSIIWGHI